MMNNKLVLTESAKFNDAIALLDKNGNGVLPVVDKLNKLLGLITDGDIRKAILNNHLDLEHIINKNPYKLSVDSSKSQIINYLKKIHRRHIPLVDEENNFVKIFTLDEIDFNLKPNWVVIMAGGLGTRLGALTKDTPKPMLQVGGKPILERIIESFVEFGFINFFISVNYKKEIIMDYFKDGADIGVNIEYLVEDTRLGTAGALSLINKQIKDPLIVVNGDILSSIDYDDVLNFHKINNADATMCVREYDQTIPYGVIETSDNIICSIKEKPTITFSVNTGIYIINPNLINVIPKDTFYDMPSLFNTLVDSEKKPCSYELKDYWIDVGRISELKQADSDFKNI